MTYLDTETFGLNAFALEVWQFTEEKMMFTLKIKKVNSIWVYEIRKEGKMYLSAWGNNFKSAEAALEVGSKKLLELLPKETFDFGQGPVAAHQHKNGGGWVADTANVDDSVYVGPNARVYEFAHVHGYARICDNARVFGHARIYGYARIRDNAHIHGNASVYEEACVCGNVTIFGQVICGHTHLTDEKCVLVRVIGLECTGPFNSPGEASKAMLPGFSYKIRKLEKR